MDGGKQPGGEIFFGRMRRDGQDLYVAEQRDTTPFVSTIQQKEMHAKQYSEIRRETNVRKYHYLCTEQFNYQN